MKHSNHKNNTISIHYNALTRLEWIQANKQDYRQNVRKFAANKIQMTLQRFKINHRHLPWATFSTWLYTGLIKNHRQFTSFVRFRKTNSNLPIPLDLEKNITDTDIDQLFTWFSTLYLSHEKKTQLPKSLDLGNIIEPTYWHMLTWCFTFLLVPWKINTQSCI